MRFLLQQRRRAKAVRRVVGELAAAAAWSPPVIPAQIRTDRHELGSAARNDVDARRWARLGRF